MSITTNLIFSLITLNQHTNTHRNAPIQAVHVETSIHMHKQVYVHKLIQLCHTEKTQSNRHAHYYRYTKIYARNYTYTGIYTHTHTYTTYTHMHAHAHACISESTYNSTHTVPPPTHSHKQLNPRAHRCTLKYTTRKKNTHPCIRQRTKFQLPSNNYSANHSSLQTKDH